MDVFIGTIVAFGFDFIPNGWALCDGRLLAIAKYGALFSLLGTKYGGDGVTSFALPDLRGRTPIGFGNGAGLSARHLGEMGGVENVTLSVGNIPAHAHQMTASNNAPNSPSPFDGSLGTAVRGDANIYVSGVASPVPMASATTAAGGNQPHNNMQPYLALNYCIALFGIYPTHSEES